MKLKIGDVYVNTIGENVYAIEIVNLEPTVDRVYIKIYMNKSDYNVKRSRNGVEGFSEESITKWIGQFKARLIKPHVILKLTKEER